MNISSIFISLLLLFTLPSCAKKVQTTGEYRPLPKEVEVVTKTAQKNNGNEAAAVNKSQPKSLSNCIDPSRKRPEIACPEATSLVCGCNGKTYKNSCEAEREGVTSYTPGKCYPISDF